MSGSAGPRWRESKSSCNMESRQMAEFATAPSRAIGLKPGSVLAPNYASRKAILQRPVMLPPPAYRPSPPAIAGRVSPLTSSGVCGLARDRIHIPLPAGPANPPAHCAMQPRPQQFSQPVLIQGHIPTGHRGMSTWAVGRPYAPFSGVILPRMTSSQLKYYPNLNPSAAVPVDPEEIFRLRPFNSHYRLGRGKEHGQYVPNMKYIFVRTSDGETLLHPRHRHPAIAAGKPVLYAGEAYFNNGTLEWWSNGSGNYRPDAAHAEQAELPMERFYSFDQILKGIHKQAGGSPSRRGSSQDSASTM
jgi:hypothetical protein